MRETVVMWLYLWLMLAVVVLFILVKILASCLIYYCCRDRDRSTAESEDDRAPSQVDDASEDSGSTMIGGSGPDDSEPDLENMHCPSGGSVELPLRESFSISDYSSGEGATSSTISNSGCVLKSPLFRPPLSPLVRRSNGSGAAACIDEPATDFSIVRFGDVKVYHMHDQKDIDGSSAEDKLHRFGQSGEKVILPIANSLPCEPRVAEGKRSFWNRWS